MVAWQPALGPWRGSSRETPITENTGLVYRQTVELCCTASRRKTD
jgi:hypothetical protein